ncbi:hypothetical protein ZIOFF_040871 [Zingiber officinale]|uniref:Uncharacterized protein n=1 Tax=Zingiber officinale TaxID=94328 RepID=A0A8J5G6T5_ZINOF|nr:hypothetical protein ZIOFF_040871 [Zingiber officinale]
MSPSRRSPLFLVCEQAIFFFPSRGQHSSDPSPSLEHCGPQPSILFSPSCALTGQASILPCDGMRSVRFGGFRVLVENAFVLFLLAFESVEVDRWILIWGLLSRWKPIKIRLQLDIVHAMARFMQLHKQPRQWLSKSVIIGILWYIVGKLKLKQIFQPPIIALALAIIIGAIPFLKNFILTDDAPLFFFTDSCLFLGIDLFPSLEAMIPCILLALGGNLVDGMQSSISYVTFLQTHIDILCSGPGGKRLGLRTTATIIFGRLVLVPPTGLGIITIADKLGLFPRGDKMFKFVLLLQHTMPERYVQHLCHDHLYAIYSGEMT